MPMLEEDFNPDEVEDNDLIPPGTYAMQIIESTMAENNNRNGHILTLTLEIIEGEFAKRRIWIRLNYTNPNATAQNIARRQLKQITEAVGWTERMQDTDVLNFKPFMGTLKITKDKKGQYSDQNDLGKCEPYQAGGGGTRPGGRAPASGGQQRPAAGGGQRQAEQRPAGGRPWPKANETMTVEDDDIPF